MFTKLISLLVICTLAPIQELNAGILHKIAESWSVHLTHENPKLNFQLSGQIIGHDQGVCILMDDSGCAYLYLDHYSDSIPNTGDLVDVSGFLEINIHDFRQYFHATSISVHGHAPPPEPLRIRADQIADRSLLYRPAKIKGAISSVARDELDVRYNWFVLRTDTGKVTVAADERIHSFAKLSGLVDAEVEIVGRIKNYSGGRHPLGNHFSTDPSPHGLTLLHPAPDLVLNPLPVHAANSIHRQIVRGNVLATGHDAFFIRNEQDGCICVTAVPGTAHPLPGQTVTVAGFWETTPFLPRIVDATIHIEPAKAIPFSESRVPNTLSLDVNGRRQINTDCIGQIIRLSGRVQHSPDTSINHGAFDLVSNDEIVSVDASSLPAESQRTIRPDSVIEISGLCIAEFGEQSTGPFPRFKRFIIFPRSADDIRILQHPSVLTAKNLLGVILIMIIAIGAILAWNSSLRRTVERRRRELEREIAARIESNFKVRERTRLAIELHDSIAQELTGVALAISSADLETAARTLKSCRKELRNCIWDLRSNALDETTMNDAIRRTLAPHITETDLSIRFNIQRERFTDNTAHVVLCIIRELAVNAIRHGNASKIMIAGSTENGNLLFSVKDNGCGFDPNARPGFAQGHFGIQGICERVENLLGEITINSAPGFGSKITIRIPMPDTDGELK